MKKDLLFHVFDYSDVDRAFWQEHLENWLPRRIIDGHVHFVDSRYRIETVTEELRRQYWVWEVNEMPTAQTAEWCVRTTFPGREVVCNAFGFPSLGWDIELSNEYVRTECLERNWYCCAIIRPTWASEQIDALLSRPGVIGVKPFYSLLGYTPNTRDGFINANILDFLPQEHLEVINRRHAWVVLHVPKEERLGHPDNLRQIRRIREQYPDVKLVIAHLGRSYTEYHARQGLLALADDPGIFFDNSAVLNPEVHYLALRHIGPDRIIYGTDNPPMYLRGRRQWNGRRYFNRTSVPLHFNTEREAPEIEAGYTLYMYEALRAIKDACIRLGFGANETNNLFHGNADRLIQDILKRKHELAGAGSAGDSHDKSRVATPRLPHSKVVP